MCEKLFERIVALGEANGDSLAAVADAMAMSLGTLYHRRKDPDRFTLGELKAFALKSGVSLGVLLGETTEAGEKANPVGSYPNAKCKGCSHELPLGGCGLVPRQQRDSRFGAEAKT